MQLGLVELRDLVLLLFFCDVLRVRNGRRLPLHPLHLLGELQGREGQNKGGQEREIEKVREKKKKKK